MTDKANTAGLAHYAYARRWYVDGEVPRKERNENGRLAWPKKFTFNEVSASKIFRDDEPLVTAASAEARISELETCLQDLTASLSAKLAHVESVAEAWKDRATSAEARIAELEADLAKAERDYSELRQSYDAISAKLTTERAHGDNQSRRATAAEARVAELETDIRFRNDRWSAAEARIAELTQALQQELSR